jgi:HSP20 family protein
MSLIRYSPMRDLDEFFERFNKPFRGEEGLQPMTRSDWMPSVDISESDDEFLIKVEVPEVKKEDLRIQVNNAC